MRTRSSSGGRAEEGASDELQALVALVVGQLPQAIDVDQAAEGWDGIITGMPDAAAHAALWHLLVNDFAVIFPWIYTDDMPRILQVFISPKPTPTHGHDLHLECHVAVLLVRKVVTC